MEEAIWYDGYFNEYMASSLSLAELERYVDCQMNYFFPDTKSGGVECKAALSDAVDRTENCFRHIKTRSWYRENRLFFNHLHGDQYAAFLYFYANSLWRIKGDVENCSKLMYLNRALNGVFISFKCGLPDIFELVHPIGSVVGNAAYNNYLVICQGVTINTYKDLDSQEGNIPVIGEGVFLGAGCKILGGEPVGKRVSVGADVTIYNERIENDMVIINMDGKKIVRKREAAECKAQRYFYDDLGLL